MPSACPDLVLMDVFMDEMSVLKAVRRLRDAFPRVRVSGSVAAMMSRRLSKKRARSLSFLGRSFRRRPCWRSWLVGLGRHRQSDAHRSACAPSPNDLAGSA